jgi:TetR/AcrR family transcriptional repressor of nem operon
MSELLACALELALADGAARSRTGTEADRPMNFEAFLRGYLSRSHRDARQEGCAIAALASDVARADEASRDMMTARLEAFIARVAAGLQADDDEAMFTVSAMVGGLLLSRVVTDAKRSDNLLRAVKNALTERHASG